MLFSIHKNSNDTWSIAPTSGRFAGKTIATAESVDLTSVVTRGDHVIGAIKAIWGVQFDESIDTFSDAETVRAMCLGKAFKGDVDRPVHWGPNGIIDVDSGRPLRQCKRMVVSGSRIFRRG